MMFVTLGTIFVIAGTFLYKTLTSQDYTYEDIMWDVLFLIVALSIIAYIN